MKKHIVLFLLLISLLLVGCGNGGQNSATQDSASKSSELTTGSTKESTLVTEESTTVAPTTVPPTSVPPTTVPPTTVHTHQWEDATSTIHHDADYGQVWVVDKPASSSMEYHFEAFCTYCNSKWSYDSARDTLPIERLDDVMYAHRDECEKRWKKANGVTMYDDNGVDWSTIPSIVYTLSESYENKTPEEGHNENRIVKEAYDETVVTGQKCKTCGEYKAIGNKQNN